MATEPVPASEARLARVRAIYDAIVAGDLAAAMTGSADVIEWRNPERAIEPGTRSGRAAFAEAVESLFAQFDFEQLEILDSAQRDDTVALRTRIVAKGRGSGAPFEQTFGQVFRFDGEQVLSFEWSPDPEAALRAVGAEGWPGGEHRS